MLYFVVLHCVVLYCHVTLCPGALRKMLLGMRISKWNKLYWSVHVLFDTLLINTYTVHQRLGLSLCFPAALSSPYPTCSSRCSRHLLPNTTSSIHLSITSPNLPLTFNQSSSCPTPHSELAHLYVYTSSAVPPPSPAILYPTPSFPVFTLPNLSHFPMLQLSPVQQSHCRNHPLPNSSHCPGPVMFITSPAHPECVPFLLCIFLRVPSTPPTQLLPYSATFLIPVQPFICSPF